MTSTLTLVSMTAGVLLLGYYLHSPLPENITDPWTLKFIIAGFRLCNLVGRIGSGIGYDTNINITRQVFATAFSWTSKPVPNTGLKIQDTTVDGVPVRIYTPAAFTADEFLPVLVYFHGGGFFVFTVDTYDNILRNMSVETRAIVIAPNYRLAPENPYPAALDDCVKVTSHVLRNAIQYGGDPSRVAVAGDSAGGNLAAAVAWKLHAFKGNKAQPKLQILLYPMLQAFDFSMPSYKDGETEICSGPVFAMAFYMYCTGSTDADVAGIIANNHTSAEMKMEYADLVSTEWIGLKRAQSIQTHDSHLVDAFQDCITDPGFSPLMAKDCSVFPKTYILSAEHDILRDENFIFESRLKAAGVKVHHDHVTGGWHGIVSYTRTDGGKRSLGLVLEYLKMHL